MGADATLVQAAYKLGQSRVPGDYSDIFNKQYEGLIASNKARYKAIGDGFKALGSAAKSVSDAVQARKLADMKADNLLFNNTYEEVATNVANGSLKKSSQEYKEGSTQNVGHIDAVNVKFDNLKNQLSALSNKSFLSKDDKKLQADLRRKTDKMKKNLVQAKGSVITNTTAYSEDYVNNNLSFKGSPNEQLLFAQVHDPNANLKALGVRVYWDDNEELQYEYTPNRLQEEYKANKRKDSQEDYSPLLKELAPGNTLKISAKKLASMIVLKDVKANNDANALITRAGSAASETIGKTKNLAHNNFDRVGTSIYNDYKSLFLNEKTNIQDLTTREVLVGNTNRTYVDDLGGNVRIDEALINQLGIGSDEFSVDEWRDGKIDAKELEAHEGAKTELIQKLTNPQTRSEREVAASELARYWTAHAKSEFDYIRRQNNNTQVGEGGGETVPGGGKKIDLGVSRLTNQRVYATRGDVSTKYDQIIESKQGDAIEGWDGKKTYQYLNEGNGKWKYQVWDSKLQMFVTKGGNKEAAGGGEGTKLININNVISELIPQTMLQQLIKVKSR